MPNDRRLARFHTPELIKLRIDSECLTQRHRTADLAKQIADTIEMAGVSCDGPTALRMFASGLERQMRPL
jgi:hypothetical protein